MARTLIRLLALLLALAPSLALAQAPRPGPTVRAVTAATDTVLNTDCGNVVQFNRATAITVTLPQAASGGNFNPRCQIQFVNIGAGNATITPTTSQIDGRSSIVLQQGGGLAVVSSGGQWVSGGIFPALSTSGIVDSDQLPTATDTVKGGIIAGTCITMGGTGNKTASLSTACRTVSVPFSFDGGGSAITTSIATARVEVPFGCTITAWRLAADASGSIVIGVKKSSYANLFSATSIAASAKPTLSSAQKNQDSTLTGWTTAVTAGDWLEFVVESATTVQHVDGALTCVRTGS